jgi:NADH-quinone oxidoreductase subunit F
MEEELESKAKPVTMKDVRARAEEKACPAQQSLVFIEEFLAEPMCGRCFPCSFGSYEARMRIQRVVSGSATAGDIEKLRQISENMLLGSMCKKGKDTATFMIDKLSSDEYEKHVVSHCAREECTDLFQFIIIPEECIMCGICKDACRDNAIIGEKKKPYLSGYLPFEIAQKRCTKCGECIKVCPVAAIRHVKSGESVEQELAGSEK